MMSCCGYYLQFAVSICITGFFPIWHIQPYIPQNRFMITSNIATLCPIENTLHDSHQ